MRKDENFNWNDPLFLVSRGIDGDLSASEQSRLNELLAASAELRVEAENLRSVARLVESRRTVSAQIDWKHHEKLVLVQIGGGEADLSDVDGLLANWGRQTPAYDERALTAKVMSRIAPARVRNYSAWRVVARLGAPLAAAAAIALVVTGTWFAPVAQVSMFSVTVVQIGPAFSDGGSEGVTYVSFAKPVMQADPSESLSFGYMTLGSSPMGQAEESPL